MRLSRDLDQLKSRYDAIVVGSGYGAGVSASRLARMGLSVAVLERGRGTHLGQAQAHPGIESGVYVVPHTLND